MLFQLTHLIFQAIRAQLSVNVSEGFLVWWNTSLWGLSHSVTMYLFVKPETQSNRETVQHHLETTWKRTLHRSQYTWPGRMANKQLTRNIIFRKLQNHRITVYFKEPVNLIEIRSCQNMFSKRFLSPFSSLFKQKLTMLHNRVRAPESSDSCNCQRRSFLKRNFTLSIIIPFLIKLPSFVVSCPSWKWKVASTKPIKFEIIHISYHNCFLIVHNIQYFVIQVTLLQAKTEVDVIYFSMQRVGLEELLHQLCLDLAITGTFEITI